MVAVCGLAAIEASARAATPALVSLEYEIAPGTDGCPDADQFRASVARQLRYDPFRATASKRVAVQIARKEIVFEGRIRWSDAEGHWVGDRRLSSRHVECSEIAASVAFSVAVQIQLLAALAPATPTDSNAAAARSAVPSPSSSAPSSPSSSPPSSFPSSSSASLSPSPSPSPPAPVTSPEANAPPERAHTAEVVSPVDVAVPVAPAESASSFRLSIGAGPSVALGVAPRTAGIGRLFASGRVGHFSLEIGGEAALPVTQQDATGKGFSLDRFAAEVAACGHASALAFCVTSTVGRMQAHGLGVDMSESPVGWFSQLGARIAAAYDFSDRFFAAGRVDGLVMTAPTEVTLNKTVVWTTPRVGAQLGLDFGARFF